MKKCRYSIETVYFSFLTVGLVRTNFSNENTAIITHTTFTRAEG
jgi:hypothetical protein